MGGSGGATEAKVLSPASAVSTGVGGFAVGTGEGGGGATGGGGGGGGAVTTDSGGGGAAGAGGGAASGVDATAGA
ncbi:MAG: hypothetical protein ACO3SN_04260, partial [Burkholderiaceae bacterium]